MKGMVTPHHLPASDPLGAQGRDKAARTPRLTEDHAGQALFETALVLPVLVVMMVGVILFGPLLYTRLAVDAASYDCVTAAAQAVSRQSQAVYQGRLAAKATIHGFRLNPSHSSVFMWSTERWGPGAQVVCRVDYGFKAARIPGASVLFSGGDVLVRGETALAIETHKSDWW